MIRFVLIGGLIGKKEQGEKAIKLVCGDMYSLDHIYNSVYNLIIMDFTKTKELLAYIVKQHEKASVTVLMKFSYLIDLISVKQTGSKISEFSYVRYFYGPYDSKINTLLDELVNENIIIPHSEYTYSNNEFIVYSFNVDNDTFAFNGLVAKEVEMADEVLSQLKGYGAKTLTEVAYKTKPMKAIGATLDNSVGIGVALNMNSD